MCRFNTNIFLGCVKSVGYFASATNVVSSNPCVGYDFDNNFLLSICTDKLISAPKTITFFPMFSFVNKNFERESNPMP